MKKVYRIKSDCTVIGLWDDFLADLGWNAVIERASDVEFDNQIGKWIVTIKNPYCCLIEKYDKRQKAIEAEIKFLNELIEGDGHG